MGSVYVICCGVWLVGPGRAGLVGPESWGSGLWGRAFGVGVDGRLLIVVVVDVVKRPGPPYWARSAGQGKSITELSPVRGPSFFEAWTVESKTDSSLKYPYRHGRRLRIS